MAVYVVDTNFFIQAHRFYYPLDVVPSFWEKVKDLAHRRKIVSIDKVKREIYCNNDGLTDWCKENLPDTFFADSTAVIEHYAKVSAWANSKKQYTSGALSNFLSTDAADAWIVAYGLALPNERTIVTYEKSAPDARKRIKIPEPCNDLGLAFVDTISMLRALKESF